MQLTAQEIRSIANGAVEVSRENDGLRFHRFTKAQRELYAASSASQASAGVRLGFRTDSRTLYLKVLIAQCSTRARFSFDVYVNGVLLDCLDCFTAECTYGVHEKTFLLGAGEKTVDIYFPDTVISRLQVLSLEDGAYFVPVRRKKKILMYGDSITQGFDVLRPSCSYAVRLADKLGAECFNKGVGGERFIPALAKLDEPVIPDYITVAYGTNDLGSPSEVDFMQRCTAFLTVLSAKHPSAKIFAVSPVWRVDWEQAWPVGGFSVVAAGIERACRGLENVTFIPGFDLIPKDACYFQDRWVHPNIEGAAHYCENLYRAIEPKL